MKTKILAIVSIAVLILHSDFATATTTSNNIVQDPCDEPNTSDKSTQEQRKTACQYQQKSKFANVDSQTEIQSGNDEKTINIPRRAGSRGGTSGSRTSGSRTSGSQTSGSRTSGSRTSSYRNTRTGTVIQRPAGWQWSRTRLVFLPIATRYFHRARPSSNRYTTPAGSGQNYYYCTSDIDQSLEIQCTSTYNDNQCCEDTNGQPYCCGGDIPSEYQEISRAAKTLAKVFYSLTALLLLLYFYRRRTYRS